MKAILGAPRWTSVIMHREECGQPSVKNPSLARTSIALVAYLRLWPVTHLSTQFRQALQCPPIDTPERNWMHAAADAAHTLGMADDVRCDPNLPLPDCLLLPHRTPSLVSTTKCSYA